MQSSRSLCAPRLLLQRLVHQLLVPLLGGQAAEVLPEVLTLRYPVHEGWHCPAGTVCTAVLSAPALQGPGSTWLWRSAYDDGARSDDC
jgi:hypothetical protein